MRWIKRPCEKCKGLGKLLRIAPTNPYTGLPFSQRIIPTQVETSPCPACEDGWIYNKDEATQ